MAPKVTEDYKRKRRLEIISAAKQVFYHKGFLQTSMQDIIDEVGLSRGAVYDYFGNKSRLFEAVIEEQDKLWWETQTKICAARPIWPIFDADMLRPMEQYDEDDPGQIGAHIEFVLHSRNDEIGSKWMRARYEKFVQSLYEIFDTGVAIGEFHPTMPLDPVVRFTISAMDGIHLGVMAIGSQDTKAPGQVEGLRHFLLDNLRPGSAP